MENIHIDSNQDIILEIMGGMGNQMFQYVFYLNLINRGKKVRFAITNKWQGDFKFELDIFPNIEYEEVDYDLYWEQKKRYEERSFTKKAINKIFPYTRDVLGENEKKGYDERLFHLNKKIISGYFQDYKYIEPIESEVRRVFLFPEVEEKLIEYTRKISDERYVGVHIRRGDYLLYPNIFGGVCEKEYYQKALEFFRNEGYNHFVFFTNDMEWVKANYSIQKALYFDPNCFSEYHDWYDMYAMSLCAHNIIANSSFSWWGAWLNQQPGHITIAPRVWFQTQKNKNICPSSWIRI